MIRPCVALSGPSAEGRCQARLCNFGPRPLALGPSEDKRVVARKLDSSANIWRSQAIEWPHVSACKCPDTPNIDTYPMAGMLVTNKQARETVELEDQQAEHQQEHDGHHGEDRRLRVSALLENAAAGAGPSAPLKVAKTRITIRDPYAEAAPRRTAA